MQLMEEIVILIKGGITIRCDEIVEETVPANLNENEGNFKTQTSMFSLDFY